MNANRVPPSHRDPSKTPSESSSTESHRRVGQVGKVDEVDPDASRSRKFDRALKEAEQQLERAKGRPEKLPSPEETSIFAPTSPKKGLKQPGSSGPSAPPSKLPTSSPNQPLSEEDTGPELLFSSSKPSAEKPLAKDPLPHSPQFLQEEDLPDHPITPPKAKEETPFNHTVSTTASPKKQPSSQMPEENSSFAPAKKAPATKEEIWTPPKEDSFHPTNPGKKETASQEKPNSPPPPDTASPMPASKSPALKGEALTSPSEAPLSSKEEEPLSPQTSAQGKEREEEVSSTPVSSASPSPHQVERRREEARLKKALKKQKEEEQAAQIQSTIRREKISGEKEREKRAFEIQGPSLPLLPPEVASLAELAAAKTAPYLSKEAATLFYQMIGTITLINQRPGVSETEVHLNAPSFAASRFFGATITIEKYASAPDSINIRLTGSSAAVAAFQQNIPSLLTAFQEGSFPFRIGRIEASHETNRPLFRRKGPNKEKGER